MAQSFTAPNSWRVSYLRIGTGPSPLFLIEIGEVMSANQPTGAKKKSVPNGLEGPGSPAHQARPTVRGPRHRILRGSISRTADPIAGKTSAKAWPPTDYPEDCMNEPAIEGFWRASYS